MADKMFSESGEGFNNRKKSLPSKVSPTGIIKKNIQCIECGFSCTSYAQLKVHNRIHTGDKPYGCPDCSYASTRNANLQRHIASMHAGRYASPATGKRGRPPNNMNLSSLTSDIHQIHSSLPSLTASSTGNSNSDYLESVTHREHMKSPLSELRAREMMLAENASQHDGALQLNVTQRVMDSAIRPRLLHPASQVLALPAHIPLTQPSVSGYRSDDMVDESPIVIDDDPVADTKTAPELPLESSEPERAVVHVEPQLPIDKPINTYDDTTSLPDDKINMDDPEPAPVLIAPSSSQDIIDIDPPLKDKQNDRFGCIVNDALSTSHLSHLSPDNEEEIPTATPGPSIAYQHQEITNPSVTNPSRVEQTTAKFNQRQPLVLEIENSSIGLYLHLDLSKYLCEAARNWLSEHTQKCTNVCKANFPVNTSNPLDQVPLEEAAGLGEAQESVQHTAPIMPISNKVPTISKAPPVVPPPNQALAFPTAILAAPHTVSSNSLTENQPSEDINMSKISLARENNVHVDQGVPQIQPSMLKAALKQHSSPLLHSYKLKQPPSNTVHTSGAPTEHNSLLFQRWPTLKQYMQVRCLAGNQKEFSCYKCGKQFPHMHQLKVHVKNHIKRYNCQQCHYSTHRMANLRRHQLTHRQVNELTCHICGGVMANKRAYTMHVLFAHKKQKRKSKEFDIWRKQLSASMTESAIQDESMGMNTTLQSSTTQQMDGDNATGMSLDDIERPVEADMTPCNDEGVVETAHHKDQSVSNQNDNNQPLESANEDAVNTEVDHESLIDSAADSNQWGEGFVKKEPETVDDEMNVTENGQTFTDDHQTQEESQVEGDEVDGSAEELVDSLDAIEVKKELQSMDAL